MLDVHQLPLEELAIRVGSSARGLQSGEAAERLRHEGPNAITEQRRVPLPLRFGKHVAHPFALLLWAGAVLALMGEHFSPGEGMRLIAYALAGVVMLNGGFSFWQETRVEQAMAAFRKMLSARARVLRDAEETEIDAREIVVGDVILLREGDRVSADARLLETHGLKVDNSPLTGESEPQLRSLGAASGPRIASRNLVFSGTLVTTGTGTALVYAIGNQTELGRIAGVTRETARVETPIKRELRHFIRFISALATALGVLFFAAGWLLGNPFWTNLVFAIGIIVANVPEGLLPTVTLGLAIAGRKMARRNALLKTLESAETLGSVTVICTDKTGTLTQNQMQVTELFLGLADEPANAEPSSVALARSERVMALCNNATLRGSRAERQVSGDPTEVALLLFVEDVIGASVAELRAARPRLHERPFDSATREMATVHAGEHGLEALLKGAPEVVIEQCNRVSGPAGSEPLTPEARQRLRARADSSAAQGRRVLALALKPVDAGTDLDAAVAQNDYEFVSLVTMHDPPRREVADAVQTCRLAGIKVIVISGDHPLTVAAVAREVRIIGDAPHRIISGEALAGWSDAALRIALEQGELSFARTSPLDKLRVVTALQQMGEIVAVTGDGVNDAPALKRANIGVAMGQSGTDVAREAADMVLMDDNFATIVGAVEEGRVIYANIRRFIGYVLTSNVPEILPYIAFVLLGVPLPLPILLILAIDLGTDMAPAIALAAEPAETNVMRQPPRKRSERLLSKQVLFSSYLLWGLIESAAGFSAYYWVLTAGDWHWGMPLSASDPRYRAAIAAFFAAVIICQVANVFVWRTTRESVLVKGFFVNKFVLLGIAIELVLAFVLVETRFGHELFGTAPLPATAWLLPIPFALSMFGLAEAIKFGRRGRSRRLSSMKGSEHPA